MGLDWVSENIPQIRKNCSDISLDQSELQMQKETAVEGCRLPSVGDTFLSLRRRSSQNSDLGNCA
jgi:hypothetical protein